MLSDHYKNHKYKSIYDWKRIGVISNDFDNLYKNHMNINNCQLCKVEFNKDIRNQNRCLDHDHETGLYRQTICNKCNCGFDRKKNKNNKSGYKNIYFDKTYNKYKYETMINKKRIQKYFKRLRDALVYKFIQIIKNNYQKNLDHFAR